MSKLTEKEVTDTIAMLTLGIRLCNTTSKSDKKYSKGYIDNTNTTNGWKTIINKDNFVNCNACTRRIKVNQKMLWHVESNLKMHRPQDCKLW